LLPAEIAERAEQIGVQKTRLDAVTLLALAVLGGAFIALGGMFATTVLAGAEGHIPFGVARLLAGLVFCSASSWSWWAAPNSSRATR
jgi:formate/nitrite transporter FocA (FNT family)